VLQRGTRADVERGFALAGNCILSHSICELKLVMVEPGIGKLGRAGPPIGGMGPVHVVVGPPVLREDLGLEKAVALVVVQVLVSHSAVEADNAYPSSPESLTEIHQLST
jgi:hypothetical protein